MCRYIAAGDVNGDGKIDVVASGSTVRVFLGNGDGSFQAPQQIDPGSSFLSIALTDLNGDGKLDVVATTGGTTIGVWLGNGDGTFQAGRFLTSVDGTQWFAVGDVSGDGHPDLVVINDSEEVGILLGMATELSRSVRPMAPEVKRPSPLESWI